MPEPHKRFLVKYIGPERQHAFPSGNFIVKNRNYLARETTMRILQSQFAVFEFQTHSQALYLEKEFFELVNSSVEPVKSNE